VRLGQLETGPVVFCPAAGPAVDGQAAF